MCKDELIEEIKIAFKDVKLNSGIGLKVASAISDYEEYKIDDLEEEEVEDWQRLTYDELKLNSSALFFF